MNAPTVAELARQLSAGEITLAEFLSAAAPHVTAEIPDASLDLDRERRCGYPEVVYGDGKDAALLASIFQRMLQQQLPILATRVSAEKAAELLRQFPAGEYNPRGRTFRIAVPGEPRSVRRGRVAVVTAGSSDRDVAEEARETLDWMGVETTLVCDVGVAGPHRLPARLAELRGADAVVVIAGMEGALPSVVGGYLDCPVIAVPTSVGYGASLGGMAALLGMLNSCAANVAVVNIDAGFKAAYVAGVIAQRAAR